MKSAIGKVLDTVAEHFENSFEKETDGEETVYRVKVRDATVYIEVPDVGQIRPGEVDSIEIVVMEGTGGTDITVELFGPSSKEGIGVSLGEFFAEDGNAMTVFDNGFEVCVGDRVRIGVIF